MTAYESGGAYPPSGAAGAYAFLLNAEKRRATGRHSGMAVNSGSRFLERCQQAKKNHGTASHTTTQHDEGTVRKEDDGRVCVRRSTGATRDSLRDENHGHQMPTGQGQELLPGTNGCSTERRSSNEASP